MFSLQGNAYKNHMRCQITFTKMDLIKKAKQKITVGKLMEKLEPLYNVSRNIKRSATVDNSFVVHRTTHNSSTRYILQIIENWYPHKYVATHLWQHYSQKSNHRPKDH